MAKKEKPVNIAAMSDKEMENYVASIKDPDKIRDHIMVIDQLLAQNKFAEFYPDHGELSRDKYPKHMEFFRAGKNFNERAMISANRTGKSTACAYELTCHMTGNYPKWWEGRRFDKPVVAWAAGEDAKTVRETLQVALCGSPGQTGTGMIPASSILSTTTRPGVPDAIDAIEVKHKYGKSRVVLKGYDQGREAYQGAKVDVIWLDEESPMDIYTESLTRTMATVPGEENGVLMCSFTPLKGWSDVVRLYLSGGVKEAKPGIPRTTA